MASLNKGVDHMLVYNNNNNVFCITLPVNHEHRTIGLQPIKTSAE